MIRLCNNISLFYILNTERRQAIIHRQIKTSPVNIEISRKATQIKVSQKTPISVTTRSTLKVTVASETPLTVAPPTSVEVATRTPSGTFTPEIAIENSS